jgi:hypothetical protein
MDSIIWQNDLYDTGNFEWKDGERDTQVVWVPNKKGRFKVTYLFTGEHEKLANRVQVLGDKRYPNPYTRFVSGMDPYSHRIVQYGKGSRGAGYVYCRYDPFNPDFSESFVCEYLYRHQDADMYYEDMIKMCHYYGCKTLIEIYREGLKEYFRKRGYAAFMIKLPGRKDYGIPGSTNTHELIVEYTKAFINQHTERIAFVDLIKDWLAFDVNDTTKSDAAMAAGYALIASRQIKVQEEVPDGKILDAARLFGNVRPNENRSRSIPRSLN